jgi:deoxyhypusine synthase
MDMEHDTDMLFRMAIDAERLGIFSIGGGVPRNNTQNVAPLIDIANNRMNESFPRKKFSYGCRIAPDAPHYGHLSGCTYSEGKSWGKMQTDGMFAEIRSDATLIWPFILKYVMEKVYPR